MTRRAALSELRWVLGVAAAALALSLGTGDWDWMQVFGSYAIVRALILAVRHLR